MQQITAQQAHEQLQKDPDAIYVDVRTVDEFVAGHPDGAVNIPIALRSPAGMVLNENFVKVIEAHFAKEKKLILGCQAGPRSDRAAEILEKAGYRNVVSVRGGFGGMRDPSTGTVVAPGWASLGLPVSRDNREGVSYESLAPKAK